MQTIVHVNLSALRVSVRILRSKGKLIFAHCCSWDSMEEVQ